MRNSLCSLSGRRGNKGEVCKKKNYTSTLFFLSCLFFVVNGINAQSVSGEAWKNYNFIQLDSNHLHHDSMELFGFYEKLYQLQKSKKGVINVVHIGDSHIQADHFSGTIRQDLQRKFGNAGRGLVFPYKIARTNEPYNYRTSSNRVWKVRRNVYADSTLPIGISGISIETRDTAALINISVKDQPGLNYAFNSFLLFHEKGKAQYHFTVCDDYFCKIGYINSANANSFVSEQHFDHYMKQLILKCTQTDTNNQHCARIYGMVLKNDSAGILYHTIGVNGAEFRHYIASEYFVKQLPVLKPDLIILSMGTNEGFSRKFDPLVFYNQVDSLVSAVLKSNPDAEIIMTTPGDSFRKRGKGRVKNPDMLEARNTLINYCNNKKLAYWDLYSIMGGYGSMAKWYAAKLSSKDRLHFGAKGYQMQGDLLYQALLEGYEKYLKLKTAK